MLNSYIWLMLYGCDGESMAHMLFLFKKDVNVWAVFSKPKSHCLGLIAVLAVCNLQVGLGQEFEHAALRALPSLTCGIGQVGDRSLPILQETL